MLGAAPTMAAESEEAGNKLSYPVLWAEDGQQFAPVPPGAMGTEVLVDVLSGQLTPDDATPCTAALQASLTNSWQADNALAVGNPVTHVDWGDNLEAKDWSVGNKVRVETVLFDNALEEAMTQYLMCYVSGQGQTESWGAQVTGGGGGGDATAAADGYTAVTQESTSAIIYSDGGRLTIQRITDPDSVSWSTSEHRWVGAGAAAPVFNAAVHEKTSDGPGSYGAELNIQGKVVYGYLWDTSGMYNGEYRLTFSLDGAMDGFAGSGTNLDSAVPVVPVEEVLTALAGAPGGEDSANTAVVAGGVTYIDVGLSGGTDAPVDPTDPGGDPTTPPSTGGGTSTPPADPVQSTESEGPGPQAGQPELISVPEAATTPTRQRAKLGMPKSGKKFAPGTTMVLTKEPIKTTAGVTVRWRVTTESRDYCSVKTLRGTKNPQNRGKTILRMREPGTCTVVAWAPAPSPEHLQYRKTFTYRIGW